MALWDDYLSVRVATVSPAQLRHADVVGQLAELRAVRPEAMSVAELGQSFEGRSISCVTLGKGPRHVLAWSQMHGDEPTHTAVLLDLINFVQRCPDHPTVRAILTGTTLHLIPMLNPDGAQRWTRRNAQSIDVNRDALHLQSPEGRLLRQAVESFRPKFALNLHNQRPRTSVGDSPPRVAAVSLLVPPIDATETETRWTRQAKQVAASFLRAVSPHCPGMISRYAADFMPRCFGEWVQQQGVATLTIEAGGWLTPDLDASPLVQVHFVGLVSALEAVATDDYLQANPEEYDALPRSGEHDLFDVMIRGATLLSGDTPQALTADLGINEAGHAGPCAQSEGGRIEDLGDLCVTTGKKLIDGTNLVCMPGRIVFEQEVSPGNFPDENKVRQLLSLGVTTVIGQVDLSDVAAIELMEQLSGNHDLPINLGWIAKVVAAHSEASQQRLERAVSLGILGVLDESVPTEASRFLERFRIPLFAQQDLPISNSASDSFEGIARQTLKFAQRLKIGKRGAIRMGSAADLIFMRLLGSPDSSAAIRWSDLQQVMVAGSVVFDDGEGSGEIVDASRGVLLSRRPTIANG